MRSLSPAQNEVPTVLIWMLNIFIFIDKCVISYRDHSNKVDNEIGTLVIN